MKFLFVLIVLPFMVFAKEADKKKPVFPPKRTPTAAVWTRGHVDSVRLFFKNDPRVMILGREEEEAYNKRIGYIGPTKRDEILKKSGIPDAKFKDMDELDKDMLVITARNYPLKKLRQAYPNFSEANLTRLQKELKAFK